MMTVTSGKIGQFLSAVALMAVVCLPTTAAELPFSKPEKTRLEVGTAGSGTTSLPLFVALDGGYFTKRGLTVSVNQVGATVAVQGIISGTLDIYQGGTAGIAANLAGADIIYVAAAVDRNSLILFGQKGIASFESLRGKSIATTFPGAFGEIAVRTPAMICQAKPLSLSSKSMPKSSTGNSNGPFGESSKPKLSTEYLTLAIPKPGPT